MIDAHLHVWQIARGDYDWLDGEDASLSRDFTIEDWSEAAADTPVDECVIVQAAPTRAETDFVLEVARSHADRVRGVVGWIDLDDASAPRDVATLAANPFLVGVRPWLQAIEDPDWILEQRVDPALAAIEKAGIVYEALIKPVHLSRIAELLQRRPALRVIIDHGGKPNIATDDFESWAKDLRHVAASSDTVACKVSGLLTEAGARAGREALVPYVDTILQAFGPERVLWGSDWPVVTTVRGYADWFEMASRLVPVEYHDSVFGGAANRFYGFRAVGENLEEMDR